MTDQSLGQSYFDELYARSADPWSFRTSDYEREKYGQTIAALGGRRFARAVEVGCSIGELTARLAPCCDDLLGVDIADAAIKAAQVRNRDAPHVRFQRLVMPVQRPSGRFDAIVLSEVLYYFGAADLQRMAEWVEEALEPDGVVLMVHWLGETPDYPRSGDEAVEAFLKDLAPRMTTDLRSRRQLYRLDRLVRRR